MKWLNQECQVHRFWGTGILKYIDFKEPGFSSTSILRNRCSQVHRFWGTQTSRPNKKLCQKPKVNPFNKWYCWNISPKKTQLPNCLNCGFGWVRYYEGPQWISPPRCLFGFICFGGYSDLFIMYPIATLLSLLEDCGTPGGRPKDH